MIKYSEETKKSILSRVTGFEKENLAEVAEEKKINKATIYNWIKIKNRSERIK